MGMVTLPGDLNTRKLLGGLLAGRRAEIDRRYAERTVFVDERMGSRSKWRTVHDLELAKRARFSPRTLRDLEDAYRLVPCSLARFDGELEPLPAAASPGAPPPESPLLGAARAAWLIRGVLNADEPSLKVLRAVARALGDGGEPLPPAEFLGIVGDWLEHARGPGPLPEAPAVPAGRPHPATALPPPPVTGGLQHVAFRNDLGRNPPPGRPACARPYRAQQRVNNPRRRGKQGTAPRGAGNTRRGPLMGAGTASLDTVLPEWAAEAISLAEARGIVEAGRPADRRLALLCDALMQDRQAHAMHRLTAEALAAAREAGRAEGHAEGYAEGWRDGCAETLSTPHLRLVPRARLPRPGDGTADLRRPPRPRLRPAEHPVPARHHPGRRHLKAGILQP